MEGASRFNRGFAFHMGGGFIFKWEDAQWGRGIGFDGGGVPKNRRMGRHFPPLPPLTMGNPAVSLRNQYWMKNFLKTQSKA